MKAIRLLIAAAVLAAEVKMACGGGPRTRPPYLAGIPPADYQYRDRSESVMLVSASAVTTIDTDARPASPLLVVVPPTPAAPVVTPFVMVKPRFFHPFSPAVAPVLAPPPPQPTVVVVPQPAPTPSPTAPPQRKKKTFQFSKALVVDDCAVSALSLVLSDDGTWSVSLRADQNPSKDDQYAPKIPPLKVSTIQILRNQFHLEFRCFATGGVPVGDVASTGIGKPIVAVLPAQEFWVERAKPYVYHRAATQPDLAAHFLNIDRIEVEFYYFK